MGAGKRMFAVGAAVGLLALSGCGRSSNKAASNNNSDSASVTASGGDFGSLKNVCGKAKGTNTASDRGVTADSIDLGTISDAGFSGTPGLNQELWDASDVFTKWCNDQGGINGRKLKSNHLDAALTQYKQQVLVACQSDFALVGGGGVFDDTGQPARLASKCLLPDVPGFVTSGAARGSSLQWQPLPSPNNSINIGMEKWLQSHFPSTASHVAYLTANVPSTIVTVNQLREVGRSLGWSSAQATQYAALGEATWIPIATQLKTQGVQGIVYVGEPTVLAKLEAAMSAISYKPTWIFASANIYDQSFIKAAGTQVINTFMPSSQVTFEAADKSLKGTEAMQQYLSLFKKYLPNGKARTLLGVDSFAAWLLFAKAAGACGADLNRLCLYQQMGKITSFDGGGLTAPADPASFKVSPCYSVVQATPTGFVTKDVQPNRGVYNCDASNVMALTGTDYGTAVTIPNPLQSLTDLHLK